MPNAVYTDSVVSWLKENYGELGPTECAVRLGKPFSRRGLVGWAYRNSVKWIRAGKPRKHDQSAVMKRLWAEGKIKKQTREEALARGRVWSAKLASGEYQHPRGMLGKKQTDYCRQQSSIRGRELVAAGKHHFQEPRTRKQLQAQAERMKERLVKFPTSIYSSARRGYRDDLGQIFFRSRWEANYARYLNLLVAQGKIAKWEFEVDTFWFEAVRRGTRSYTPDFKIYGTDGRIWYEEVKGWMDKKSATKLKRMKKYHPTVEVILVTVKEYTAIEKEFGKVLPHWEFKEKPLRKDTAKV